MAKEVWGETVQAVLDALLIRRGDAEISAEEAKQIYGGSTSTTLNSLTQQQLVQVALLEAYAIIEDIISQQADEKVTSINRATRRNKK
jgi:hypothetical protein